MLKRDFPFFPQLDRSDCGASCLRMISKYYSKNVSQHELRESISVTKEGATLLGISQAAEFIGFRTVGAKITFEVLKSSTILPCVCFWNQAHFVIVYKINREKVYVADPAIGLLTYKTNEFLKCWISSFSNETASGIVLALQPGPNFYSKSANPLGGQFRVKNALSELVQYLRPHKRLMFLLLFGLSMGSIIQWTLPFFTQSIVDIGISNQNMRFIVVILIGQLIMHTSMFANVFVQQLISIQLGTRINISAISDFLSKLFTLPLSFFEGRIVGDLLKRIEDHYKVEQFLSTTLFSFVFASLTLFVFATVLFLYSEFVFIIFAFSSLVYICYILIFLRKRRQIDYKRFQQLAVNESNLIQIIHGIIEIKLNNSETFKKWEWEKIQARVFKANIATLKLSQYQAAGGQFINSVKNLLITAITGFAVINNEMTLGMMMAVQFMLGQINAPVNEFVNFVQKWQDAKIALERINEVKAISTREDGRGKSTQLSKTSQDITLEGVTFSYGPSSDNALNDLNLTIPANQVTAIVGPSGSGKTTLLKLLLKFYSPTKGTIVIGNDDFSSIGAFEWRRACGVVMQDGYIFGDTIARNIALSDEVIDYEKLYQAAKSAFIHDFVASLPLNYDSNIGAGGVGLSQGQRQRLLIARALYKRPTFIMLDEATSSLDANSERAIMDNMKGIFHGRTVLIIAHRLSTIKCADQIVVMDRGTITEIGTHDTLIRLQGEYFNLVQNQLI